jgi:protein TonB
MPRDLFKSGVNPNGGYPQRRWTLALSLIVHGTLLAALVTLSLASALDGPQVVERLQGYFVASPPPEPPPPPAAPTPAVPTSAPAVNPNLAPLSAPPSVTPEAAIAPVPTGFGLSTSFATGVPGGTGTTAVIPSAPPPPASVEMLRVGGIIRPPARLVYVPPSYPPIAQTARIEGDVILEAVIDETGAVRDVKVIKSVAMLDRAAIDAVAKWRYSPTRLNGVAVPVIMTITVRFALR